MGQWLVDNCKDDPTFRQNFATEGDNGKRLIFPEQNKDPRRWPLCLKDDFGACYNITTETERARF